ncbi:MAG: site-2 protease family protein [Planctomycetota bacterium]|jgi:Zn-dependent protease|nr:site-2 protease family protein [Planctomycetota bacterium]
MDYPFLLTRMAVWYVIFLFSTTLHEAAHAYAGARGGDHTAYASGQVTLNPIPHIRRERFGMVVVPLLSFILNGGEWMIGWASAPFNPLWAARYPRRALGMALAGPLIHLLPALIAWIGMAAGLRSGFFGPPGLDGFSTSPVSAGWGGPLSHALAIVLGIAFQLNFVLLFFNLMPFPPMDGSEIWFQLVKSESERLRLRQIAASYALPGMLLAWYLFPRVFYPVFYSALSALYSVGLAF